MLLYLRMACPHFLPREPFAAAESTSAFPRPLGDSWRGQCASPLAAASPDDRHMLDCCNMGYCAGKCQAFPAASDDAVRFGIVSDNGSEVRVQWVAQRDHLPSASGRVTYNRDSATFPGSDLPALLEAQVRAYLTSYLRRLKAAQ